MGAPGGVRFAGRTLFPGSVSSRRNRTWQTGIKDAEKGKEKRGEIRGKINDRYTEIR